MNKIERYCPCPECNGTGKVDGEACYNCDSYGEIENEAYWRATLPNPIPFKEGREAQLEYYNLKRNG